MQKQTFTLERSPSLKKFVPILKESFDSLRSVRALDFLIIVYRNPKVGLMSIILRDMRSDTES